MIINKIINDTISIDGSQKFVRAKDYQIFLTTRDALKAVVDDDKLMQKKNFKAYQQAKIEGYQVGFDKSIAEITQQKIEFIKQIIDWTEKFEKEILESMKLMLEKIIDDKNDNDIIKAIIRKSLKSYTHMPELVLHISPCQEEVAKTEVEKIAKKYNVKFVKIEVDPRLKKNDCILESATGSVDASLDIQLNTLKKTITSSPITKIKLPLEKNKKNNRKK